MIPFARRRERRHLIEELQQRLRRKDRGTQTDFPVFLPIYEEAWTETSDIDSYTSDLGNNLLLPDTGICGPSRCHSQPVVAQVPLFCYSKRRLFLRRRIRDAPLPRRELPYPTTPATRNGPTARPANSPSCKSIEIESDRFPLTQIATLPTSFSFLWRDSDRADRPTPRRLFPRPARLPLLPLTVFPLISIRADGGHLLGHRIAG